MKIRKEVDGTNSSPRPPKMPSVSAETIMKELGEHIKQKGVDNYDHFAERINALPENERGDALKKFFNEVGAALDPFAKGAISERIKLNKNDKKEIDGLLAEEVRFFV